VPLLKPFKVTSFRTLDRKALQLAGRELGHGLLARSPSELASIRGELSGIAEEAKSEYAQGFLDAIEHLLAGHSAELKHRRDVTEDVKTTHLRRNATKVLLALHAGCQLPSEIADKTGLKASAVSTELLELEREHLVERVELAAAEDQRKLPRALTIRGLRVVEELARGQVSPAAEAARELAPLFVTFMNRLADESCLAPVRLKEIAIERLGVVSGAFVCDEFLKHADQQRIILFTNSMITETSSLYRRRLRDVLLGAMSPPAPLPAVLEHMKHLASEADVCLRATVAMRNHWQMALSMHGIRNVHPWCLDDARVEQLPLPAGDYQIVWENPQVMTHDLDDHQLRPYVEKAKRRHCYVTSGIQLPHDVERIVLDARHGHG
jgi:DNA-binding MarR family transcriptional regulator